MTTRIRRIAARTLIVVSALLMASFALSVVIRDASWGDAWPPILVCAGGILVGFYMLPRRTV